MGWKAARSPKPGRRRRMPMRPIPSLGTVPTAKPPPPDAKLHASMAGGLVADRTNAQYDAKLQPLPAAGPSVARRRAPPPAAPDDPDQPNASLPAANAQPVASAKPVATVVKPAPVAPVAASPLAQQDRRRATRTWHVLLHGRERYQRQIHKYKEIDGCDQSGKR